jgi:hypothetical protein
MNSGGSIARDDYYYDKLPWLTYSEENAGTKGTEHMAMPVFTLITILIQNHSSFNDT